MSGNPLSKLEGVGAASDQVEPHAGIARRGSMKMSADTLAGRTADFRCSLGRVVRDSARRSMFDASEIAEAERSRDADASSVCDESVSSARLDHDRRRVSFGLMSARPRLAAESAEVAATTKPVRARDDVINRTRWGDRGQAAAAL